MTNKDNKDDKAGDSNDNRKVVSPKEAGNEGQELVEATNKSVDAAGEEAAKRLEAPSELTDLVG